MPLPILSYGHQILREECNSVPADEAGLETLIANMWATMYRAEGCGLAASQVGEPLRLFVVDSVSSYNNMHPESRPVYFEESTGIKEVFINARITEYSDRSWKEEEGCLSLPGMQVEVERPWSIQVEYVNENFEPKTCTFCGVTARMIQHEYDHTRGILHIDQLTTFQKKVVR